MSVTLHTGSATLVVQWLSQTRGLQNNNKQTLWQKSCTTQIDSVRDEHRSLLGQVLFFFSNRSTVATKLCKISLLPVLSASQPQRSFSYPPTSLNSIHARSALCLCSKEMRSGLFLIKGACLHPNLSHIRIYIYTCANLALLNLKHSLKNIFKFLASMSVL